MATGKAAAKTGLLLLTESGVSGAGRRRHLSSKRASNQLRQPLTHGVLLLLYPGDPGP